MTYVRFGTAARLSSNSSSFISPEEHILKGNVVKDSPWVSLATQPDGFVFWCLNTILADRTISFSNWLSQKNEKNQMLWVIEPKLCQGEWYNPCDSDNPIVRKRGKESREVLYKGNIPMSAITDKGTLSISKAVERSFDGAVDIGLRVTWLSDSYVEPLWITHTGVIHRMKQLKALNLW